MDTIKTIKPKIDPKEIVIQGVGNLLGAGDCFNIAPLEPTISRSLREIHASRQDNWKRHQLRMKALRQQRQTRTVDAYLYRALRIYAQQHSEQSIITDRDATTRVITQKDERVSAANLTANLPPPKRRGRVK